MTGSTARAITPPLDGQWMHWLFVRGRRAISCDVDVSKDGRCTLSLSPLWTTEGHVAETFASPADAIRRHAQIARHLRMSGWLLADSGVVRPAA